MHRFFVTPECINGDTVALPGGVARQLAHVLRSRPGALRPVRPKRASPPSLFIGLEGGFTPEEVDYAHGRRDDSV